MGAVISAVPGGTSQDSCRFTQDYRPGLLSARPFGTKCGVLTQTPKAHGHSGPDKQALQGAVEKLNTVTLW